MIFINKFHLLSLIRKYGVQLLDHAPGEVTVKISSWNAYEQKLNRVITYLQDEDDIYSIHVQDNIVNINYDPAIVNNDVKVKRLFALIDEYNL